MHNCKITRKLLTDQVLGKTLPGQFEPLQAELEGCTACREEFASLRSVLRVADQAMESALPEEAFWPGYHVRLRQRLESSSESAVRSRSQHPRTQTGLQTWLRKLVTASVPVPLVAVLVVVFGLSLLFAMNSRRRSSAEPLPAGPSVVTRTVEVPVIHERTVTRVVYRDRSAGTSAGKATQTARTNLNSAVNRQNEPAGSALISLVGFKPANEVKLTIIKGNYSDEK